MGNELEIGEYKVFYKVATKDQIFCICVMSRLRNITAPDARYMASELFIIHPYEDRTVQPVIVTLEMESVPSQKVPMPEDEYCVTISPSQISYEEENQFEMFLLTTADTLLITDAVDPKRIPMASDSDKANSWIPCAKNFPWVWMNTYSQHLDANEKITYLNTLKAMESKTQNPDLRNAHNSMNQRKSTITPITDIRKPTRINTFEKSSSSFQYTHMESRAS